MAFGKHSPIIEEGNVSETGENGNFSISSDGIMEYQLKYSFDEKANKQDDIGVVISDRRYYRQKSPIWDESDHSIFSKKYIHQIV